MNRKLPQQCFWVALSYVEGYWSGLVTFQVTIIGMEKPEYDAEDRFLAYKTCSLRRQDFPLTVSSSDTRLNVLISDHPGTSMWTPWHNLYRSKALAEAVVTARQIQQFQRELPK